MAQRRRIVLRPITAEERAGLERVARAGAESADRVARAKALLAVAGGVPFVAAARAAGRLSGDAVAHLAERFNAEGTGALDPRHGGGPPVRYGPAERERILREFRRQPERVEDGTAAWSLSTLRRALRRGSAALPTVSTATILHTLWEAGYTWQRDRSWCSTGTAKRKRKDGTVVQAVDPEAAPKKS